MRPDARFICDGEADLRPRRRGFFFEDAEESSIVELAGLLALVILVAFLVSL